MFIDKLFTLPNLVELRQNVLALGGFQPLNRLRHQTIHKQAFAPGGGMANEDRMPEVWGTTDVLRQVHALCALVFMDMKRPAAFEFFA